ncbi:tyrosine-type recombinase/integrase [Nonomuraea africana]|uniref:Integrase n=1 Tax=Nonomuraea africana TaxID=46171 RepID=A0ABR9K6Q4_9ACTN|nr:tyrosine-type recombinase/integrase [Nonomuraea africana]MBE1557575.1 integrase [Nonomuraea africana]
MIYEHPLAYVLGLEGIALMRAYTGEHDRAFVEARLAEIRKLLDNNSLADAAVEVARVDTVGGYRIWSQTYDGPNAALNTDDFDADAGVLTVRNGKFGKSRLLPLHPTSSDGIGHYLRRRSQHLQRRRLPDSGVLFISTAGTRLDHSRAQKTWRQIRQDAGLRPRSANCRPRIHDLRHSFAVATLLDWYRTGQDVPAMLPRLATYLGHADPKHTFWYLSAAPELLALAGDRLEDFLAGTP